MCGILAHCLFDEAAQIDEAILRSMADTMVHRGPDDAGYWVRGRIGLAHRRLSIIDLSAAGRQPMENEDGTVRLTFNGEIYNFAELRRELEGRGHRFKSSSDSEVILHGYEEWGGPGCLSKLRGMFAFVIWDDRRQALFAARDRLGIKPLYYRNDGSSLIIASELKAILKHPEVQPAVDTTGLLQHFGFRFTLPPRTAFEGISKLAAGHSLSYRDGRVTIEEYWRPPGAEALEGPERSLDEWSEALRAKLSETVEGHLISDVPVGAFLSGGLDSGSLVALASEFSDQPVQTYTAGFGSGWHDESSEAKEVASMHATDHHETQIQPSTPALLEKMIWHLEEPLINTSSIPLYAVSELASRDVKVVLAGDGSDEVNGGYQKFGRIDQLLRWRSFRDAVPGLDGLANFASGLLPTTNTGNRIKRLNQITQGPDGAYAAFSSSAFSGGGAQDTSQSLFAPEIASQFGGMTSEYEAALLDDYRELSSAKQRFFLYDMRGWMANELLIRADKITMAHSLEARVPFLDHELVELCLSMPPELKVTQDTTKAILRKAMQSSLPSGTTSRKQHGFVVPIHEWIRGDWREQIEDLSRDTRCRTRGIFNAARMDTMIDDHMKGKADWTAPIFGFLLTELWHQTFIDS
ncbi:MAG: asparagine synthase (glutamine-hydrolyzing) [Myxococcota bacterium]|nr:asparagine synthase (glutamine-hydrolyzing) [Myxococcota bacterium]